MANLIPRTAGNPYTQKHDPYGFKFQENVEQLQYKAPQGMSPAITKPQSLQNPTNLVPKIEPIAETPDGTTHESQESSGIFAANPITGAQIAAGSVKPAMDIANVISQKALIEKQYDAQKNRTIAPYQAAQTMVRGVQDLPSEVLNQVERNVAAVKSQYSGSDPVMDLVSKQMAEEKRTGIRENAAAVRGQHLIEERRRVDKEKADNTLRAADVANRNIDRQQELADYKLSADVNRLTNLRKLSANVLTDLSKNLDTRAIYNTQKDLVQRENKRASISSTLAYKVREKERLQAMGVDIEGSTLDQEIRELARQRDVVNNTALPSYDKARSNWLSYSRGGKLMPR